MKKLLFTALFSLAALCSPAQAPLVGDGGHYDTATHETLFLFVASPDAKNRCFASTRRVWAASLCAP